MFNFIDRVLRRFGLRVDPSTPMELTIASLLIRDAARQENDVLTADHRRVTIASNAAQLGADPSPRR